MSVAARTAAGRLLGRNAEVELLTALLDGVDDAGSTLVFHGEPGVGKSRLLSEAARLARERDITVVRTTGVQAEAQLAFAGLHQLVRPIRDHAANLPAPARTALDAAFGVARRRPSSSASPWRCSTCSPTSPQRLHCWSRSTTRNGWTNRRPTCWPLSAVASRPTESCCSSLRATDTRRR